MKVYHEIVRNKFDIFINVNKSIKLSLRRHFRSDEINSYKLTRAGSLNDKVVLLSPGPYISAKGMNLYGHYKNKRARGDQCRNYETAETLSVSR